MSKIILNQDLNFVSDSNDIITDLDALTDVNITAVANGQILVYNGSSTKWENVNNSEITGLTALSDVTITSVADEQFLRYDSGSGEWVNETVAVGGAAELNELTDVTITSVADDQFLRYDSGSGVFVNETVNILTDITGESVWDLSDVSTSGRVTGGVLHYDGSNVIATSTLDLDLNIGSTLLSNLNNRTITLKPGTATAGESPGLTLTANQTTSGNGFLTGTIESFSTSSGYGSSRIEFTGNSAGDGGIDFSVSDATVETVNLQIDSGGVDVSNVRFVANNKATLKSDGSFDGIEFDTSTGENQYRINITSATGAALTAGDKSQLIGWEINATDGIAYPVLLSTQYDGSAGNAFVFNTYDDGVSTFTVNEVAKIGEERTELLRSLNLAPYASGSLPGSPSTGDMVRVTDENNAPYYYDGTDWLNLYDIDGGSY